MSKRKRKFLRVSRRKRRKAQTVGVLIALLVVIALWRLLLSVAIVFVVFLVGWVIYRVIRSNRHRYQISQSGIDDVDKMSGADFENKMRIHFDSLGWRAIQTQLSGDYGADLIVTSPEGRRIAIQLKRYNAPVGLSAVQEVVAAIRHYGVDSGMVITNSHLTNNARKLATSNGVEVWEREELIASLAEVHKQLEKRRSI